jgi:hypothetical protein
MRSTNANLEAIRLYNNHNQKTLWNILKNRLTHRCNDLLHTERVLSQLEEPDFRHLGRFEVPVNSIVGSSGRSNDFDLEFNPLRNTLGDRWIHIAQVFLSGKRLPPVQLYKIADAFFVVDGHHRLSVAKAAGQQFVCANVIEINIQDLKPESSCARLGYKV